MEIPVTIEHHCIETASRRLYESLITLYFKGTVSDPKRADVENRLEALLFFLEHADFSVLRHRYPELNGTVKSRVILNVDAERKTVEIHCQGSRFPVPFKQG